MSIFNQKKLIWKGYIVGLYVPKYITFWKRQSYGNSKKICGFPGGEGEGGMNTWGTEDFEGNKTVWHNTVALGTCH